MSTVHDLRRTIASLAPPSRATLINSLLAEVEEVPGITKTPGVCGGEPCVAGSRISVSLLEKWRRSGVSEAELLDWYPTLTAADVANARLYATAFADEINAIIREDDEGWAADEAQARAAWAASGRTDPFPGHWTEGPPVFSTGNA